MEIHCSLYEFYHLIGDDRNALMHFVRYRAIHDSLEVLKNVKKIGQLHLQYETERTAQQIASLGILNRENTRRNHYILAGLLHYLHLSAFLFRQYWLIGIRTQLFTDSTEIYNRHSQKLSLPMKDQHHREKTTL